MSEQKKKFIKAFQGNKVVVSEVGPGHEDHDLDYYILADKVFVKQPNTMQLVIIDVPEDQRRSFLKHCFGEEVKKHKQQHMGYVNLKKTCGVCGKEADKSKTSLEGFHSIDSNHHEFFFAHVCQYKGHSPCYFEAKQLMKKSTLEEEDVKKKKTYNCAKCNKVCEGGACANCKSVHYCSKECQRAHWSDHKMFCKIMQENNKKPQDEKDLVARQQLYRLNDVVLLSKWPGSDIETPD